MSEEMIIKRDGREKPFSKEKVEVAIEKAFIAVDGSLSQEGMDLAIKISESVESEVHRNLSSKQKVSVEDIQDIIERKLMSSYRKDVAKAFITYRSDRSRVRERNSKFRSKVREKVYAKNVVNQNANVDEKSFGGRKGEADSVLLKEMALDEIMSKMSRDNHLNNEIYIHDLDSYVLGMHNCLTLPFKNALKSGVNTRQTDIREAGSVNTAMQLVAVLFQIQSLQQFGGVSSGSIDHAMVPYVRKSFTKHIEEGLVFVEGLSEYKGKRFRKWLKNDENHPDGTIHFDDEEFKNLHPKAWEYAMYMTENETRQAAEGLMHNLNSLQSRSGNQLPFSSINYGTCTIPEGRMVTKSLLEASLDGVGKFHRTSIFPCGIFQYKKGINDKEGTPNYDLKRLALKSTSKRLYPNYANEDWSQQVSYIKSDRDLKNKVILSLDCDKYEKLKNIIKSNKEVAENLFLKVVDDKIVVNQEESPIEIFSTMGCRTANGADVNFNEEDYEKLIDMSLEHKDISRLMLSKAQKDGRGNICPVTIILPTLAMEVSGEVGNKDIKEFLELLDKKIHEAKDMLIERYKWICSQDPDSAKFMYENGMMAGYFPEEGIISALKHGTLALGQLGLSNTLEILIGKDQTTSEGLELAKSIESLFQKRCAEFKEEYKLNIGVYFTPAENLAYTAMQKFKEKYGEIPNVSDRDYFTNSIHVPVWKKLSPFDKIDIESQLTGYSNAGCITYVEVDGSTINNIDALEEIVDYAMNKDIPYFAINVPSDTCLDCGYQGEFNDKCPECGSTNIQQLRRVTGYLSTDYHNFNKGKQKEVKDRVRHVNAFTDLEGESVR